MNRFSFIKTLPYLFFISLLPLMGSCEQEDNLETIFLGKTWKLTGIYREKKDVQITTCGSEVTIECLEEFEKFKNTSGYFTLVFGSLEQLSGRAAAATFEGRSSINSKNREFDASVSPSLSETDAYSNEFITGINSAYKYWGDIRTLKLYYKVGTEKRYLLFRIGN